MAELAYPLADLSLARRLERAEAASNVESVESRKRLSPEVGATWIEVGGAYAMFDGPQSPLTQTFGLGMCSVLTAESLDTLEDFFRSRGAAVFHEVCPLSDPSTLALLNSRFYQPVEMTNVLFRPIETGDPAVDVPAGRVIARQMEQGEEELWAQTAALGWSEYVEYADMMLDFGRIAAARSAGACFFAELDGRPIATGAISIHDGVALLAGASTVPEARKQGAQRAILAARLQYSARLGCDIAMMCAQPGSTSQRNAERQGFRIAYTRTKWHLQADEDD